MEKIGIDDIKTERGNKTFMITERILIAAPESVALRVARIFDVLLIV